MLGLKKILREIISKKQPPKILDSFKELYDKYNSYNLPHAKETQKKEFDKIISYVKQDADLMNLVGTGKGIFSGCGIYSVLGLDKKGLYVARGDCGGGIANIHYLDEATSEKIQESFPNLTPKQLSKGIAEYIFENQKISPTNN